MMELFNNIWSALSTPNEIIINIFLFFCAFIESYLIFNIIVNIFNIQFSKKKELLFIFTYFFIGLINLFLVPLPFNTLITYLCIFILNLILFKVRFFKNIIMTFCPSIIFALTQFLILSPYLNLLNINYDEAINIPLYRIPLILLGYIIVFVIAKIFKIKNIKINILVDFDKKHQKIIILNLIFGFLTIIVQFIMNIKYIDNLSLGFSFFNFICLLVYFLLSIYSLTRVIKLADTTQKLESAEEYNKTLHILHDSVRGFKHDFDNIVTTIGGYIKTNDMDGLKKYYSQLESDCQKVNNLYVLDPDLINNPGVYNLITTKYNEALEKDIKVNLTFLLDLNELHMKIYEFARILGILLDNAIEAASESDEKILYITFRKDFKNNMNLIVIENSYKDKDVNIDDIFSKGVSGKENHTGLGLWEVRQILKKNNNINLYTTKNSELFTQKLEIYY